MAFEERILHDKDIREPLFFFLEETYGKVRILEEKHTGSARADVVMITPQILYEIEIKSDADSYTRLKKQVKYYDWYYDRNIIIVGSTHATHVREHVPDIQRMIESCRKHGYSLIYKLHDVCETREIRTRIVEKCFESELFTSDNIEI